MTNEEKQALIKSLDRRIKIKNAKRWLSAKKKVGSPENEAVELISIYEIALTALTAQPVKLPNRYDISSMVDVEKDDDGTLYLREDVIDAIHEAGYEVQEQ